MLGRGVLSAVMDEALELVAPTRCVGCDEPGALLCDECLAALPWVRQELACPNCGAPAAKTFSASGIKFEGSGFYNTDQRSGGSSTTATSGCCANCPHNH